MSPGFTGPGFTGPSFTGPALTVIVKALNEAGKIEACLRSILAATDPATTEVIVADSLSDDGTAEIAGRFPVRVVQLSHREDRGCGSAAQLGFQHARVGFQHARGQRLLLLDGDMELAPEFLPAANRALDSDPRLAGVGGLIIDRVMTLEFQRRAQSQGDNRNTSPGPKQHLNGGGLFQTEAIQQSGYLTDRNLHACEEQELGMRLTELGWRFLRLDVPAVSHYGHATEPFRLLANRWRTKYVYGQGEFLRAKLGSRQFRAVLRDSRLYGVAVAWWGILLLLLLGALLAPRPAAGFCATALPAIFILPFLLQWRRKRELLMAVYSVALVNLHGAGLVAGFFRRRRDPRETIASRVIRDGTRPN